MTLRQLLRFLFLLVVFLGCGEPTAPPTPVAAVDMVQDTATLVPGATLTLSAAPLDAQGRPLTRTITWASSNGSVASVAAGHVTALAPGSAVISATATATTVTGKTEIIVKPGAVLGPAGATLNLLDGRVVVVVPAGAVSASTQLIVDPVAPPVTSSRLVGGTSYSIDAPSTPTQPFIISLSYDPANVKTGAPQSSLKIYALKSDKWERVAGSAADPAARTVTAPISAYGVFAVLEQAPGTGAISAGNTQTAVAGSSVAVRPAVRIIDTEGFPVPGVQVVFTVTAGNGAATGTTATTDAAGIATVGDWTLGAVAGANTLTASFTGAAGGPLQFQATGVPGAATALKFVQSPPASVQNRATFSPITLQLTDKFGNSAPTAGITVTASLTSGSGNLGGTVTRTTSATGLVTFNDLVFSGSAGPKTIAFASSPLTPVNSLFAVTAGNPHSLAMNSGDNQTALAGSAVSTLPSVRVSDADGNAMPGVPVRFAVSSGGGTLTGADVVTDASGLAQVGSWVLGTLAGTNTLTASTTSLSSTVVFQATATAGTAGRLAILVSPSSSPSNRTRFAVQPQVQVQDAFGNPVTESGVRVTASIVSGDGQLTGDATVTTNSSGVAVFTNLSLAGTVGPRTLRFSASSISPASVGVTLRAGRPVSFAINGGNNQTAVVGSAVLTRPSVVLKDADENRVAGSAVTFQPQSSSGTVTGGAVTTDSLGVATVGSWTLGTATGTNLLNATTTALSGTILQFAATAVAGSPASIVLDRGADQRVIAGRGVQSDVMFRVLDSFGNGVPSATVNFVASQGGTLAQPNATAFANGYVRLPAWTLGPSVGTQTITATVFGASIPSATVTVNSVKARIVTFGDSNTDIGFQGTSSVIRVASYLSVWPERLAPSAPNSPLQLAGKIETQWTAGYASAIEAVNHGISETTSGSARSTRGAPGARTIVGGLSRYDGEVLGNGFPWLGGEPAGDDYPGQMTRLRSYIPTSTDFAYVSIGTNDSYYLIQPTETLANLQWMAQRWVSNGFSTKHFFLTTLPPNSSGYIPEINRGIRSIAAQMGVQLIDIAAFTSDDDGLTWKQSSMHVGDFVHYSESVREWIAGQVVAKMAAATAPPN